ncbi:MAG: aminotransferase class I/II-fold pyridoxal phosphate-dependent enzyme [Planctomycetes bacterium]|nr:aminotransferase class I/II-fold pyridoxal phosphate-dependent enzyme [Planctomycetota bacterium]
MTHAHQSNGQPPGAGGNAAGDALSDAGFETICAHYADDRHGHAGAVVPPIYQVSTFLYRDAEAFERRKQPGDPQCEYTRWKNPTTMALEAKLARLEAGNWARCFASGMGAITAAINACVESGAHVVCVGQCYWPTRRYLSEYLTRFGVRVTFVNGCDPDDFVAAFEPDTRLLYLESPTSGFFEMPPAEPLAAAARQRGITTIFDNSWATPYFQRPLELGCDLVVHSATKFIGGHSDVVAGALIGRDEELGQRLLAESELLGATPDPFAAWLLQRGLRTLAVRMERHQQNGLAVAHFLEEHPRVARVHHPGLASHPQHELARRQLRGYASLFSFELKEQTRAATHRFLNRLKLFGIGVSWGGHESLAVGGTLFSRSSEQELWLIRLHIGLETVDDLISDLRQALEE